MAKSTKPKKAAVKPAESYVHPTDTVPMRPEIGTQASFRKKKAPKTYRYDSSLSPTLEWDAQTGRAVGEWLLEVLEKAAALPPPHEFSTPREFKDAESDGSDRIRISRIAAGQAFVACLTATQVTVLTLADGTDDGTLTLTDQTVTAIAAGEDGQTLWLGGFRGTVARYRRSVPKSVESTPSPSGAELEGDPDEGKHGTDRDPDPDADPNDRPGDDPPR